MKQEARIKELLGSGMHSKCLFHFTAENKREVCLVCVRANPTCPHATIYGRGEQICVIGSPDDPVLWARIELDDFYALMFGRVNLPSKLKMKEMIL
jgi:hypothetical protein